MSPEIHDAVLSGKSSDAIRKAAQQNGFRSMISDGIEKVLSGKTTFEEVVRTTRTN
jgi:type II secretory ATPase GspE/PulE/Tfp pilus assembly ATPase PilB-like protein